MTNAKAVPKEIPFFTMLFILLPPIQMMYLVLSFIYIFRQTEMKVLLFRDVLGMVVAFNGSPKAKGNTYHAIRMVADEPAAEEKVFTHFIR